MPTVMVTIEIRADEPFGPDKIEIVSTASGKSEDAIRLATEHAANQAIAAARASRETADA